jgi:chromate transporter
LKDRLDYHADMHAINPSERPRPQSLKDLFISFTLLALQGFGGVLPVVQRELVEKKRWMSNEEFMEDWAIAQVLPGPNVVNLAVMLGARYFGVKGALSALAGMLALPLVIVLFLAVAYTHLAHYPAVTGALRGMGAVAAGLIAATALKFLASLSHNVLGRYLAWTLAALYGLATAWLHVPLAYVFLAASGACVLAFRRLRP